METALDQQTLAGRYRLEGRLAGGGMAEVYRAVDLQLDRPVAVKLPYPHFAADPDFAERLRREARAIAALSHPNIVAVYDCGETENGPFLVMELVEGESLAQLLARQGPLPPARAVAIARDVLAALEHAHARGLIHRDVKPQNVLLSPDGRARLVDFGIAQAASAAGLTRAGEVFGSVHYLAPERLAGQPATPAADLYGVGIMLHQMLVGRLPFEGDLPAAVAAQHQQQAPARPSAVRPGVPAWLDQVVLTALAKNPADRFPSATAMRQSLDGGEATSVHEALTTRMAVSPPSPGPPRPQARRAGGRGRRWPVVVAVALGLLLLLAAFALPGGQEASRPNSPSPTATVKAPAASPTSPAATPTAATPSAAQPAAVRATPAPTVAPTPTASQRLADIRTLLQRADTSGRNGKGVREVSKQLGEIEKSLAAADVKDARGETQDLIKKVQEMARKGELDRGLADQLVAQLSALAAQLR